MWNSPSVASTGHASFTRKENTSTRGEYPLSTLRTQLFQLEAILIKALLKSPKETLSQACQYQGPRRP